MKKVMLGIVIMAIAIMVGVDDSFSATVNNPMTEDLNGGGYVINNIYGVTANGSSTKLRLGELDFSNAFALYANMDSYNNQDDVTKPSWGLRLNVANDYMSIGRKAAGAGGTLSDLIRIDNQGNVGIGTTTPSAKLEVNGDFIAKGPWVDVRAYGAKGDGTTDDTTAIQNAISANPGKTILFPAGTFLVSGALATALPSNTQIVGLGNKSVIKRAAAFTGDIFTLATGATDILFFNFSYDGNRTTGLAENYFINGNGNTRLCIAQIYAHDMNDKFVNLYGTNNYFRMLDCIFENSRRRGVTSLAGSYGVISGNIFYNINDGCIDVIDFDDGIIANNVCYANGIVETSDGIAINYGNRCIIKGNTVYTTTGRGISVYKGDSLRTAGSDVIIEGNIVTGSTTSGAIAVETAYTGVSIENNVCIEGKIYVNESNDINILDNKLKGTEGQIVIESVAANISTVRIVGNHLKQPKNRAFDLVANTGRTISNVDINTNRVDDVVAGAYDDIGICGRAGGSFTNIVAEDNIILGAATRISGLTVARRNNRWTNNAVSGRATLSSGTVTVNTSEVESADNIHLTRVVSSGTRGHLFVGTITAGTSFVISSSSGSESSTVFWEIVH